MANYLDRVLGEEGIKTDVQVSLKPDTYVYLFFLVAGGTMVGIAAGFFVKGLLK